MTHTESIFVRATFLMPVRFTAHDTYVDGHIDHRMIIRPQDIHHNKMWTHINLMLLHPVLQDRAIEQ